MIAPNARLLSLRDPIVPMIEIMISANQKTVSIIFNTTLTFVFAHRFSLSTWAVKTW